MNFTDIPDYGVSHAFDAPSIDTQLTAQNVKFDPAVIALYDKAQYSVQELFQANVLKRKEVQKAYKRIFNGISNHIYSHYVKG